ncbi:hypothetical protein C8J56DRAFT_885907 [Mycena floridula]|nr:hypothetical protein C8J56DRAFT_885907 [Mycena floridula]
MNQTAPFNIDPFSGIQGMGSQATGLFGRGLLALFGIYLTPLAVGDAELTIGGIDNTKFESNLTFANNTGAGDWELSSTGISTTALFGTTRNIIFDSGTSNIVFSTNITEVWFPLLIAFGS